MSLHRNEFLRLLDQSTIDLAGLEAASQDQSLIEFESLIGLSRKLPSGFIHADALWLIATPPAEIEPLAPGSAWYAVGRELLVVVPSGERWNAVEILETVYAYFKAAQDVFHRLSDDPAILDVLLSGEALDAEFSAQCALKLDASIDFFHKLEEQSPELKFDLGWMGRREFKPVVHVHSSLRPQVGRKRGEEGVRRLIQALPEGPIRLMLSDDDGVFDPISPYVRDLAEPICQWAKENGDRLSTSELHEKIVSSSGEFAKELAALVLPDLLTTSAEISEEKRVGEAQAGLHFVADGALKIAWASMRHLDGADALVQESASSELSDARLVIVSSVSEESLLSVARLLLATGRVTAVGGVFSVEGNHLPAIVSSNCFVGEDEGVQLGKQNTLLSMASEQGIEVENLQRIDLDSGPRFNRAAFRVASIVHRQRLVQGIEGLAAEPQCLIALYRKSANPEEKPFRLAWGRLQAHRLTLAALFCPEKPDDKLSKSLKSKDFRV